MNDYWQNYMDKRRHLIKELGERTSLLDDSRVNEFKEAIWKSYKTSTLHPHIARISHETIKTRYFRSIGIRSSIKLSDFNAESYWWTPYFSDVGRLIAQGEQKYFYERLGREITGVRESISRLSPDFSILNEHIGSLFGKGIIPDTLLAPIRMFGPFMKFYGPQMDWSQGRPEKLKIHGCELNVIWSHKYAQLRSFIILDSRAGIWRVIQDEDTRRPITIALGESIDKPGQVEYWVETIARYIITDDRAFCRINISR